MELTMENILKQEARIRMFWNKCDELYPEFEKAGETCKKAQEVVDNCLTKIEKKWYHKVNPFTWHKMRKYLYISQVSHKDMVSTLSLIDDYNNLAHVEIEILKSMAKVTEC